MLNAANEVAVDAFLNRRIRFTEIASIIDDVLNHEASVPTVASKMCWRPTGVPGISPGGGCTATGDRGLPAERLAVERHQTHPGGKLWARST